MGDIGRPSARIIAFPPPSMRLARSTLGADQPRGEIVLFMGVRYEHLEPQDDPSRPLTSDRQPRGRRRRV